MTEQLKTLMDRAADPGLRRGRPRRDHRSRATAPCGGGGSASGVAGVAVLAVVATGAVLLGGDGNDKADVVDDPFRTDVPMWTEGSTLHTPAGTYDLGVDVFSFVRTSEGIVFTGLLGEETLGVYSFTGKGEPEQIGETDDPHLRSDADGPYAGWLDRRRRRRGGHLRPGRW